MVSAVGYEGEALVPKLKQAQEPGGKLNEVRLPVINLPWLDNIPLLRAVVKGIGLLLRLMAALWRLERFDVVLIQNPPCLPALVTCLIFSYFVNDCIICIDWHNLGFSMYPDRHSTLAKLSRFLEGNPNPNPNPNPKP